jgi:hypothetical protein
LAKNSRIALFRACAEEIRGTKKSPNARYREKNVGKNRGMDQYILIPFLVG